MPVQIGQKNHSFADPTALLFECHRRIEMFLGLLEAAAKTSDQSLTDEAARALSSALRYFREAAPKHTADEEESLFPRLRQIQQPEAQSTLGRIEELERDHRWADQAHAEVEKLGQAYLSNGRLSKADAESFRAAVDGLARMYGEHIRVEDEVIFPVAARVLSRPEQLSMGREMAARRNVRFEAPSPSNADSNAHKP